MMLPSREVAVADIPAKSRLQIRCTSATAVLGGVILPNPPLGGIDGGTTAASLVLLKCVPVLIILKLTPQHKPRRANVR